MISSDSLLSVTVYFTLYADQLQFWDPRVTSEIQLPVKWLGFHQLIMMQTPPQNSCVYSLS